MAAVGHTAVIALRLAVEDHVTVAAHLAVAGQAVGGHINVRPAAYVDDDVVAVEGGVATGDEGLAHIDSRLGVSQVRIVASTVAGFLLWKPGLPINAAPGGDA